MTCSGRYGHVIYFFDEFYQKDGWHITYDNCVTNAHIDLNHMAELPSDVGIWISIKGVSGIVRVEFISEKDYCKLVENGDIDESYDLSNKDPWSKFGFNDFYTYERLLNEYSRDESSNED